MGVVMMMMVVMVIVGAHSAAVERSSEGGEAEDDAVHDAERKRGLEHGTRLVRLEYDAVNCDRT